MNVKLRGLIIAVAAVAAFFGASPLPAHADPNANEVRLVLVGRPFAPTSGIFARTQTTVCRTDTSIGVFCGRTYLPVGDWSVGPESAGVQVYPTVQAGIDALDASLRYPIGKTSVVERTPDKVIQYSTIADKSYVATARYLMGSTLVSVTCRSKESGKRADTVACARAMLDAQVERAKLLG